MHKARQTKFTVYRHRLFDFACGWAVIIHSDFKLVKNEVAIAEATPFNCSAQGVGAKLFIHVGGDNKLRIQFAWPNNNYYSSAN